jgi:hypothetical protein
LSAANVRRRSTGQPLLGFSGYNGFATDKNQGRLMLLRSVSENLKSQNWIAVWLDLVIVVVGIFLGLQASQWYEYRQEVGLGESILERLQLEFEALTTEAHGAFQFHQEEAVALEVVRRAVTGRELKADQEAQFLTGLREAMDYDLGPDRSATFVEVLSSGQFRLIQNPELRAALNAYDDNLQKGGAFFTVQHQNQRKHDAVWSRHFTLGPSVTMDVEFSPTGRIVPRREITSYDLEAMADDAEFINAIDRLIEYHTYYQYWHNTIWRAANRVLELTDANGD